MEMNYFMLKLNVKGDLLELFLIGNGFDNLSDVV